MAKSKNIRKDGNSKTKSKTKSDKNSVKIKAKGSAAVNAILRKLG